ncbi:uncharacterized protein [Montipora foliosa]|uniref:uncharacterized protein n=1 Tax=Montipora foliosa TaxID=591990 RepID=UPI0035F13E9A
MSHLQSKRLQYSFRVNKSGLDAKEFESCLTSKVDAILEFHRISNIDTSLKKEAIRTVTKQVCVQKRGRHYVRPQDEENRRVDIFNDFHLNGSFQSQVKNNCEWKNKCHMKQHLLFSEFDALRDKFERLCKNSGSLTVTDRDGYLYRGQKKLTAPELCNVIDLLTADLIRDLSMLRENANAQRPTVNYNKVSDLCEDILLDRFTTGQASKNDLMDEGDCQSWKAHVMVMISFAALMVVAEMTKKELKQLGHQDWFYIEMIITALIFVTTLNPFLTLSFLFFFLYIHMYKGDRLGQHGRGSFRGSHWT